MMPRDVSTRWNSTYDMLQFALDYRVPIDKITSNRELNLRKYELQDDEWAVAETLRDTLKARMAL
jgi:viroplasmin and RNaseH domain-containing protein